MSAADTARDLPRSLRRLKPPPQRWDSFPYFAGVYASVRMKTSYSSGPDDFEDVPERSRTGTVLRRLAGLNRPRKRSLLSPPATGPTTVRRSGGTGMVLSVGVVEAPRPEHRFAATGCRSGERSRWVLPMREIPRARKARDREGSRGGSSVRIGSCRVGEEGRKLPTPSGREGV